MEKGKMRFRAIGIALMMSFAFLSVFAVVPTYAGTMYGSATITRTANPTGESNKWWFFDETWTGTVDHGSMSDWTGYEGTLDLAGASISVHFISRVHKSTYNGVHEGDVTIMKDSTTITGTIKGRMEAGNYIEGRWVIDSNTKGSYKGWKTCTFTGDEETWDIIFFPHGFDEWGYNYDANLFVGELRFVDRDAEDEYGNDWGNDLLIMKWSDNWLPQGNPADNPTQWEGAWLTNHFIGEEDLDGSGLHHYTYFAKIVYVGDYTADPSVIPDGAYGIWGHFAVIEEVYNSVYYDYHGIMTHAKPTGFGAY